MDFKDCFPNQSKLNCEVLSPELGLQLRWSLAGSSIILQIVANLGELLLWNGILFSGSEMYMAIGVKAGKVRLGENFSPNYFKRDRKRPAVLLLEMW